MGLLLSVLITTVGVVEAVTCFNMFIKGMVPEALPALDRWTRKYDNMFAEASTYTSARSQDWKRGGQGYLHIQGGGSAGPMVASIKYFGEEQDSTPILFSTKISSFGQDSLENDNLRNSESPEKFVYDTPKVEADAFLQSERYTRKASPESSSFWDDDNESADPALTSSELRDDISQNVQNDAFLESERYTRNASPASSNFWDDENESTDQVATSPEPKEKIKWHYRPLTPTDAAALPEIHFDSYERKSSETGDQSGYSNEFLRSLDGVKFQPLQRDDGTGRRKSYKKRHSSSSNSSRESKASREEELKAFTSLEEDEFENYAVLPEHCSAPNLSVDYPSKPRSRHDSKERKSRSPTHSEERRDSTSPSGDRPRLKDLPKVSSFEEMPNEEEQSTVVDRDFALSQLNPGENENEEDDSGVSFWET